MGIRGSATYELVFTDCKIPKENVLGEFGKGFKMALMTLDGGRIGVAAQAKQDHEPFLHLAAMGKLYAAEDATNVTRRCAQLASYDGCSRELPFERYMRDAKITEIYEETSEVQRMVISSYMGIK